MFPSVTGEKTIPLSKAALSNSTESSYTLIVNLIVNLIVVNGGNRTHGKTTGQAVSASIQPIDQARVVWRWWRTDPSDHACRLN